MIGEEISRSLFQSHEYRRNLAAGLREAAICGDVRATEFLINLRATSEQDEMDGSTPLHLASSNGDSDVIRVLLRTRPNMNIKDHDGFPPLHCAVSYGHLSVTQLLVAEGADVDTESDDGISPLYCAVRREDLAITQELLAAGADPDAISNGKTPLHRAALNGSADIIHNLLWSNANKNIKSASSHLPLHFAAIRGHVSAVVALIRHRSADVEMPGEASGAVGARALQDAAYYGHTDVIEALLGHGACIDSRRDDGSTPLHEASFSGHLTVVRRLLDEGANVEAKTTDRSTALHLSSNVEVVGLLLERGADKAAKTIYGETPLDLAHKFGRRRVVELLRTASRSWRPEDLFATNLKININSRGKYFIYHDPQNDNGKIAIPNEHSLLKKVIKDFTKHPKLSRLERPPWGHGSYQIYLYRSLRERGNDAEHYWA